MSAWIKKSFKNRIFLTILLVALLPLLLCAVIMIQVQLLSSEQKLEQQAHVEIDTLEDVLTDTLRDIDSVTEKLTDSTVVRSAMRQQNIDSRILYQVLYKNTKTLRDVAQFDIYDKDGICCYTTAGSLPSLVLDPDWGILYAAKQTNGLALQKSGEQGLLAARAIRAFDDDILGYMVVTIEKEGFETLFSGKYTAVNDVILMDPTWRVVYYSNTAQGMGTTNALREQLMAGSPLTGSEGEYNFYSIRLDESGLTLILQQPRTFTREVVKTIFTVSLTMALLCLILCLCCSWIFSLFLSKPLYKLDAAIREVEKGNYEVKLETNRTDEFGKLARSFNRMTREYLLNLENSVQRQKELNKTQIRMMQAQLNPHFLCNTLDAMKWLGVTNNVPQVATLATNLATVLRASISEDEFVTLQQELDLIEHYIDIQLIRFEDKFTYEIDIDDRFQSCLVPKLVLQPLVENAIIHGVKGLDDGYIKISAEEQDGDLLLIVTDNGQGFSDETMEKLLSSEMRLSGNHLGLYNVDKIIRLHYGEQYGLSIESKPGMGSRVQLRLPIQRKE